MVEINICHYFIPTKAVFDVIKKRVFDVSKYLISQKINISNVCYHNYMKIKIDSVDDLSLEKSLSIQNAIMCKGPIFNKY